MALGHDGDCDENDGKNVGEEGVAVVVLLCMEVGGEIGGIEVGVLESFLDGDAVACVEGVEEEGYDGRGYDEDAVEDDVDSVVVVDARNRTEPSSETFPGK